jgi:Methyltransferase domain
MEKCQMKLQKIFNLLILGFSASCLALTGCTQQDTNKAQAEPKTPSAVQAQDTTPPATNPAEKKTPDVVYVPTPQTVVDKMLEIAKVNKNDFVYDLGSGDGRLVITAAQKFGTQGIGIDIDPERIKEANANAKKAGVSDKVQFLQQDLFKSDFSKATVVTLYLLPELNVKLRPQLFKQLKPGTRIVSHAFDMGDWKPEKVVQVDGRTVYYWTIPKEIPENLRSTTNSKR